MSMRRKGELNCLGAGAGSLYVGLSSLRAGSLCAKKANLPGEEFEPNDQPYCFTTQRTRLIIINVAPYRKISKTGGKPILDQI